MALLERTDHATYCPYKGDAPTSAFRSAATVRQTPCGSYEAPYAPVAPIRDYLAFYPEGVDAIEERPEA
jgi:uncharacterized protein (DUF427 family)